MIKSLPEQALADSALDATVMAQNPRLLWNTSSKAIAPDARRQTRALLDRKTLQPDSPKEEPCPGERSDLPAEGTPPLAENMPGAEVRTWRQVFYDLMLDISTGLPSEAVKKALLGEYASVAVQEGFGAQPHTMTVAPFHPTTMQSICLRLESLHAEHALCPEEAESALREILATEKDLRLHEKNGPVKDTRTFGTSAHTVGDSQWRLILSEYKDGTIEADILSEHVEAA